MIRVKEEVNNLKNEVKQIRRYLHQIPELGLEEYKTREYIRNYLKDLNIEVIDNIAKTGVIGFIKGTEGKKTLAFRADMDGLPICEKTELDFSSKHKGKMHACGHDGHMAILLGFAKYLSMNTNRINDNILLIFQPAEEGPGGAEIIIKEGILEKYSVEEIYGLHLYPDVNEGRVAVRSGPIMAMTGEIDINIQGQSGHGAIPQSSVDSILIAGELISSYQSIVARNISPISPGVITIGRIEGGERRNVIAGNVVLEGTVRAFDEGVYNKMKSRMESIAKGLEIGYGCKIDLEFRDMYPPVINDERLVKDFIKVVGSENIDIIEPQMTAEDFSYYQKVIPGLFFFLGVKNEDKDFKYPLHNAKFNFNEDVLLLGIQIYIDILKHNNSFI